MPSTCLPERPDILLTIAKTIDDNADLPMTREEIMRLVNDCHPERAGQSLTLFTQWRSSGHLRERRGRYYVLSQHASSIEQEGITPLFTPADRLHWIRNHASFRSW